MPPPLLFMRTRSGADQSVQRYSGATPASVGSGFSTIEDYLNDDCPRNRVVQFENDLYTVGRDGVYKKDDPTTLTGPWSADFTFATPSGAGTSNRRSGLYVIYDGDQAKLTAIYGTASAGSDDWRAVIYDANTATWSETAEFANVAAMLTMGTELVFNNVLHIIGDSLAMTWDVAGSALTARSSPFQATRQDQDLCVFNGRLFCVYKSNTDDISLAEYTSGAWTIVPAATAFAPYSTATAFTAARMSLFTDGTFMYALVGSDDFVASSGWRCYQFDAALSPTDITAAVLPASLISTGDGGTFAGTITNERFFAYPDADTTPGSLTIWLYHAAAPTAGTSFSLYQWNGPATLIGSGGTPDDSGGDVAHAPVAFSAIGGDRAWTAGELDIRVTQRVSVLGGQRIYFKAWGQAGFADKTVQFRFSTEGESALTVATLRAASATGGTAAVSGNTIVNVDADDGVTEFSAIWDTPLDGLTSGQRAQLVPEIST